MYYIYTLIHNINILNSILANEHIYRFIYQNAMILYPKYIGTMFTTQYMF